MDANTKTENQGVSVGFMLKIFRTFWVYILIVAMLCAGGLGILRYFTKTPTYTSSVTFFVNAVGVLNSNEGVQSMVNPGNTTSARDLAETFGQIVAGGRVIEAAHDLLQGGNKFNADEYPALSQAITAGEYQHLTESDIRLMLSVSVSTQIIEVNITHPDPATAYAVAQAVEIVTPGSLDYFVGIENDSNAEKLQSAAKVIERAQKDNVSSGTGAVSFALLGFALGAILVYLIAFLRTYFDNTVYTEEALKDGFDIPVIGQIPSWNSHGKRRRKKKEISHYISSSGVSSSARDYSGRLLGDTTPFAVTEAFKLLRTNMFYTTKGESCAVYGVTSATMGAGKSVIVANTAISFGQMGKRVLLIDGDLRCPVLHRIFKLDAKADGLSEMLAGVCADGHRAIRTSSFANVDVLTSGRIPPNPAELLASARMREFIAAAKQTYDVIFIDLPPICDVTDAGVISDIVTGYAFVVRSGCSDRRLIGVAADILVNLGGSIIGFVLNDVDIKSGDYYKNRYSGYSTYGRYAKYGKYAGYSGYAGYGYADPELKQPKPGKTDAKSAAHPKEKPTSK